MISRILGLLLVPFVLAFGLLVVAFNLAIKVIVACVVIIGFVPYAIWCKATGRDKVDPEQRAREERIKDIYRS